MEATVYRSAVDAWLVAVPGAAGLIALSAGVSVFVAGDAAARGIAVLVVLMGVGLPVWILTTPSYTLSPADRAAFIADLEARRSTASAR